MFSRSRTPSMKSLSSQGEQEPPVDAIVIDATFSDQNDDDFDDQEDHDQRDQPLYLSTAQSHPMGRILLSLLKDSTNLAEKAKLNKMECELNELCTNFYDSLRLEKAKMQKQRRQVIADIETSMIEKELNSHMLNLDINPPNNFSPTPTLLSARQRADAMKLFPCNGNKFTGSPNHGFDITEYLSMVRLAQEQCGLSEKEFKEMLLCSTTGKAHAILAEWIGSGDSVAAIFHNFLIHFDKRGTPEESKQQLLTYKAPKNLNLAKVEAQISSMANRAATLLPPGDSRQQYRNLEIIQTLIRCLPITSSSLVQTKFNELSARLGRAATYIELSRALNLHRHVIDNDIRSHGVDPFRGRRTTPNTVVRQKRHTVYTVVPQAPPQTMQQKRPESFRRIQNPTSRIQPNFRASSTPRQVNLINRPMRPMNRNGRPGLRQPFRRNGPPAGRSNQGPRYRARDNDRQFRQPLPLSNNNYCSLCGKRDHTASSNCPNMVNDSGAVIKIHPTHGTCSACPAKVRPRLNHPPAVCPYRQGGPFHRSG